MVLVVDASPPVVPDNANVLPSTAEADIVPDAEAIDAVHAPVLAEALAPVFGSVVIVDVAVVEPS